MPPSRRTLSSFSVCVALLLTASCAQSKKVATTPAAEDTIVSSTPPFQTKEPERYRATRTITTVTAGGETVVTRNNIARNGELRRDESETASGRVVYLNRPEGRFALLPDEKLFAELSREDEAAGVEEEQEPANSPDRLLHTEPIATSYQKVGVETAGGRTLERYRVVVNISAAPNVTVTETLIWIDEALHMPVKSESISPNGTRTTMELSDVSLDVDERVFQIPADYEKVAFAELLKRLKPGQP